MSAIQRIKIWNGSVFLAAAVAAMAFGPAPAEADVFQFLTPDGATAGGQPVSAKADITTSTGQITITLTNLLEDPTSIIQAISDFYFTVNDGSLTNSSLTGATSQETTIDDEGVFTQPDPIGLPTNPEAVGWVYSSATPTEGYLNVLDEPGPDAAGPEHLIIGPPGGATYTANGSIEGNEAHNPFLYQFATFYITGSDISASTQITSFEFSFGTTHNAAVPEPASFATVGVGTLLGLGYAWRKRKRAVV